MANPFAGTVRAPELPPDLEWFNSRPLSLADLRALLDLAAARRGEIGEDAWLDAYARAREPDIRLRAFGIDALNRVSIGGLGPLRSLGIRAIHDVAPVRHALMRLGLGLR